ncbi:hypothetical protein [Nonomuraea sp. NPDC049695]
MSFALVDGGSEKQNNAATGEGFGQMVGCTAGFDHVRAVQCMAIDLDFE